jgi:hypothetical protein
VLRWCLLRRRLVHRRLLLCRWRFGRGGVLGNLVGHRHGQRWSLHLRRKLWFILLAGCAQQEPQNHNQDGELAGACHAKWNTAASLGSALATAEQQTSRIVMPHHKPRMRKAVTNLTISRQCGFPGHVRVTASTLSGSWAAASGSTRRKVVPWPISVTKSSAPLCNCNTR